MKLRVHSILEKTTVNGPGERFTIWTQGCTKGCAGCFNPHTWAARGGQLVEAAELADRILASGADGLTLTGGDPLEQPLEILELLNLLHDDQHNLIGLPKGILCFTGFTREEIMADTGMDAALRRCCLLLIDVLIDGRFVESLRYTDGLAGSSNQRFHFLNRAGRGEALIGKGEVITDQAVEIHPAVGGLIQVTGFPLLGPRQRAWMEEMGVKIVR